MRRLLRRGIGFARFFSSHGGEAVLIDGKSVADDIKQVVAKDVALFKELVGRPPGLGVVFVGSRKASEIYVHNKTLACDETGISSSCTKLPEGASEEDVLASIRNYNEDPSVDGILVQLPIPKHLDEDRILSSISLEKDVDGCHPVNIGNLALKGNQPLFVPCTAKACLQLLLAKRVQLSGRYAVVIGCGNIAGLPISLLLQQHNATVTRVHALTKAPEDYTRKADIVISATGSPNLVRGNWLKQEAVVLDVGISHIQDPCSGELHLIGDVCIGEARKVASLISPVPGGVGPVTIAMLLQNTMLAAKLRHGFHQSKPESDAVK
ncbi:hypothetical protein KP509_34G047700 [Ceratopteris richardii]|uniref:Methenyltetrahydrofolate cyclohydrolase n=1 Tax=Ceratopteris richardii TaxID=49495 RepID=A0A8T2QKW5_CERRI|nr:hypothetical protein KP509_34G047700 [Ceratopteris richardii]KAH7284298.1 hypothetical protein KP509_34G047700 [Ceratopteris richardii]KAH7284299.1 hypothetical protein KP509_34G047700 [Ceratopteris richardii]